MDKKFRGDLRAIRARAKLARFEAIAEQQRQGVEKSRFACACFAGQDREPVVELDLERIDDGEVADR